NRFIGILVKFDPNGGSVLASASHTALDPNGIARFNSVTVDSAGRYVAVGESDNDFLVARLTPAMQPDMLFATFATGGFALTDFSPTPTSFFGDSAFAARVLANGKIVAAGDSGTLFAATLPAIARY